MSTDNALVIKHSKRFSLLIDPEMQGLTWLKAQATQSGGASNLYVLKQSDPNFQKMMEMAIEIGKVVIVEQVHQHVGMNLQSIMKKQVSQYAGSKMLNFCRKQYKYAEGFDLFVVSTTARP